MCEGVGVAIVGLRLLCPGISGFIETLPWSLHSVAGTPQTARKKKPAIPVGMTAQNNAERSKSGRSEDRPLLFAGVA
jgi:hypothetical protein